MNTKNVVRKKTIDLGIGGVTALALHCGLSYERTRRVWEGDKNAKYGDVLQVCESLGLPVKIG